MQNFDTYLFRGPRPTSMANLKECGFKVVINLQSGAFELLHQDAYENEVDQKFGLKEYNFPLSDVFAPSVDVLRTVADLLAMCKHRELKTYIHCAHGVDRTGMCVAAYQILHRGVSAEYATRVMLEKGFHKWPYLYWFNWPKQLLKLEATK